MTDEKMPEMITNMRRALNEVTEKLAQQSSFSEFQESSTQMLIALKSLLDHYAEGINKMTMLIITPEGSNEKSLRGQVEKLAEELGDNIKGFRSKLNPRLVNKGVGQLPPNVGQIIRAVIDYTEESTLKNIRFLGEKSEIEDKQAKITAKLVDLLNDATVEVQKAQVQELYGEYKKLETQAQTVHLKMLENQSFQDLTGQALQLLIWLVNSVENNLKRIAEENQIKAPERAPEPQKPDEKLLDSQSAVDDLLG
jgi:chemotaxis regulatin CheY-phosphate phosphatase CheZ